MSTKPHSAAQSATSVLSDASQGNLAVSQADDPNLPRIGLVGDTYATLRAMKEPQETRPYIQNTNSTLALLYF
jgi:hypothetical protein